MATLQLKAKQAQADVLRRFKDYINFNPLQVEYQWVSSHEDGNKSWDELSLREKMNVTVNKLAKLGIIAGAREGDLIDNTFPFERVRITIDGHKVGGDIKKAVNEHWSYRTAKALYHSKGIIDKRDFDFVYWDAVEAAGKSFPKRFRDFITKQ